MSEADKEQRRKWRLENPDYYKDYSKKWRKNNPNKRKDQQKRYRSKNPNKEYLSKWQKENAVKCNLNSKKYKQNNPEKVLANKARRRARKLNATPPWLTKEQFKEIEQFYLDAQEIAWLNDDGRPHHVDHIIPLQSDLVCGLHVPWNLQLLTAKKNLSKHNKLL